MTSPPPHSLSIVGAGLAGALLARLLALRGWQVDLYERRSDPRAGPIIGGRSINLALAERGWHALRLAGVDREVAGQAIAMRGRAVHAMDGEVEIQPYGLSDAHVIHSVHRANLNRLLVARAADAGARLHFEHGLKDVDWESSELLLETPAGVVRKPFTRVIGADGAGSPLRIAMAAVTDQLENWAPLGHGYKELSFRPTPCGDFRLDAHALHIWPRGEFMLIALPNADRSFTVTLFLPLEGERSFARLQTPAQIEQFFASEFPSAVPLLDELQFEFEHNPLGQLGTLRLSPWHFEERALLIGDAAHAVVPFHGQGMNCAFEDCAALAELLDCPGACPDAFERLYALRKENADAIAAMALDNYQEMRDSVAQPGWLWHKQIETALTNRFPERVLSRYAQVSFTRIPYAEARRRGEILGQIVAELAGTGSLDDIDWSLAARRVEERLPVLPVDAQLGRTAE
jgi:kynurenine 3-monooxygenase